MVGFAGGIYLTDVEDMWMFIKFWTGIQPFSKLLFKRLAVFSS